MKGRLSIRTIGICCIAVLAAFISVCTVVVWQGYQKTIEGAVDENQKNLELAYMWDLLQDMDEVCGEILYAQPHEYDEIRGRFDVLQARAQDYLAQIMAGMDGERYYNIYDISKMVDTYNKEFQKYCKTLATGETAAVFLWGMRNDLGTLNGYIKDELGGAIVDHLNSSKENMERSSVELQRAKNRVLVFASICTAACVAMILLLVRLIRKPVDGLIDRMDHFRNTGSVDGAAPVSSILSEMSLLEDSFDSMAEEIVQKQENERRMARLEMNNMEMQHQLDKARLDTLQAQVNPHFLFNTLNAIYALTIREDARSSGEMIAYLSAILRYSLSSISSFVAVDHEMEILSDYLHILKLRFGDTIAFEVSVDDGLEDAEIPSMVIQPLIENAIMHAFDPPGPEDRVEVSIRREGEDICITVADNGSGMSPDLVRRIHTGEKLTTTEPGSHHGIGLDNVVKRMNILYGPGHIRIDSRPGAGTRFSLMISHTRQEV